MNAYLRTLAVAAALMSTTLPSYAEVLYTLTEIGAPTGESSYAYGINDSGLVVGTMAVGGASQSFVRDSNGVIHAFTSTGTAFKISNTGQMAGWSNNPAGGTLATSYSPDYSASLLPGENSRAWGLNDSGMVVGSTSSAQTASLAAVWDSSGNLLRSADRTSEAFAINNSGQIAGWALFNGYSRAVIWSEDGGFQDLGSLHGPSGQSNAFDINDAGQVVGASRGSGGASLGFIYDATDGLRDVGTLAGQYTRAMAINDAGQVVGESRVNGAPHGFIYLSGRIEDLNDLIDPDQGWTVSMGFDINSAGQIVGYGTRNGVDRAILLTPIPEPGTWILLASAVMCIGSRRKSA